MTAHVEMLTSVHEEVNGAIDWEEMKNSPSPFTSGEDGPNVIQAIR